MQVLVHLPVGYDPSAPRRYPVIIGLHGYPSVPRSFTKINFLRTIDSLTSHGRLQPSIVVIPQINNPRSLDTECVNGPVGEPQTDTWLSREVPEWVVRHFHVRTDRQSWAALGYSFGGWCAAELAMRHPSIFGAAIDFEGYFELDFGRTYDPITPAMQRSYDLIRMARTDPPPVGIWIFGSEQDRLSYPTTRRFLAAVRPPLVVSGTIVPIGGHRTSVFEPFTAPALIWLARTLPGFRG
jgi:predicted peptidase